MSAAQDRLYAVLDVRDRIADPVARERSRELGFAWMRWSYAGEILEDADPDALLAQADARGAARLLVFATGGMPVETLRPKNDAAPELARVLGDALDAGDSGAWLVGQAERPGSVRDDCWLVDLARWRAAGRPTLLREDRTRSLRAPAGAIAPMPEPALRLWRHLEPERAAHADAFRRAPDAVDTAALSPPLGDFVASIARTLAQCQRGVFIWNLESYDDIAVEQAAPLRTLYCVAAGFKPNAILRSHGFSPEAEVVFMDYSREALAFRKWLVEDWNGRDLPAFLWPKLDAGAVHYWLRSTARGGAPVREELEQLWARELQDWGGADAFAEHWTATRRLRHRYVHADLLHAPEAALGAPAGGPALVWWSNAFSSVHALWHLRHAERVAAFARWIRCIAASLPEAWLLGADANNSPVGGIRAATYAELLAAWDGSMHAPLPAGHAPVRF